MSINVKFKSVNAVDLIHTQCILLIFTSSENVHRQNSISLLASMVCPKTCFWAEINSMMGIQ